MSLSFSSCPTYDPPPQAPDLHPRPLDYTPFFYLLMAEAAVTATIIPWAVNPRLRRSELDK